MTDATLPLIARAATHARRTALHTREGTFSYGELLDASARVAAALLDGRADLGEAPVAFLVPPSFAYVATQWGIWRAGGVAVPLAVSHPPPELEYVIDDTRAGTVVAHPELADRVRPIVEARGLRLLTTEAILGHAGVRTADDADDADGADGDGTDGAGEVASGADAAGVDAVALPAVDPARRAMILYTSGTTSRPKGVVSTHANVRAQVTTLVDAWEWRADDHILCVLPLHHVHGIINVVTCALWSGAACTILPRFDAGEVWEHIARGELTLFMAVPTIYARLTAAWEAAPAARRAGLSAACRRMRLMVSGSAALPVGVLERWREIGGHTLLERYGMTEIGMALSNPLHGERRPGHVGAPLPGVQLRLVDEARGPVEPGSPGEIEVRGASVFLEYWRRPDATAAAFRDGWFRTGDIAVVEDGAYRILGRSSVDIIKTGGYKASALEIEETLRSHPDIRECAVVGVPDAEWGERVAVAVVARPGAVLSLETLRAWAAERLAPYKIPTRLATVEALPRNALGKVTKPAIRSAFERA